MWKNILKGLGQQKDKIPEQAMPAPIKPAMPVVPTVPALPGSNPNRMTWAQAAALKKLRGF